MNGEGLSFQWEFEGASSITGSTLRDPGFVTYNHAGHFRTRLIVTATGTGAQDFGYRFVSIYDRPDQGPNRPIVEWEIEDLNGSRKSGGFLGRVKIWEPIGNNYLKDGALVVIFSDDFYGATEKNLGGNAENCAGIFWVGYVLKDSIVYDYKEGTVEFDLGSVTEMMKQAQGFSVSCQADTNPNTWFKIKDMTIQKAMYHYLKWHSTVPNIADFQYTGDDRPVQYFDSSRESLYDSIAKFVETGIKGELVSDRQGKLWTEISAQVRDNARTTLPVCMPIFRTDWVSNPKTNSVAISSKSAKVSNGPIITERQFSEISYVEYGGIAYSGPTTGTFGAFLSAAPGQAPAYKGDIDHMEGMILLGQDHLNRIVGNSWAYQNSKYPEFAFPMAGAFKNIDIAPLEIIQVNVDAADTPRGTTLVNEPFHVMSQEWRYYSREKSIIHTLHLAQLTSGTLGQTILIAPTVNPKAGGFNVPSLQVPAIAGFSFPASTGTPAQPTGTFGSNTYAWFFYNAASGKNISDHQGVSVNTANLFAISPKVVFTPGVGGLYVVTLRGSCTAAAGTTDVSANISRSSDSVGVGMTIPAAAQPAGVGGAAAASGALRVAAGEDINAVLSFGGGASDTLSEFQASVIKVAD